MSATGTGAGRIAVIGSANADLVVRVDRRPDGGETILGSDLVTTPGGKGANQAVAAGLLGADVRFVGCVGGDPYGELLRASLARAHVDVSALATVPAATGCALIFLTPDGENSIVVAPGANSSVTPDYLRACEAAWSTADVVVMQLEIPMDSVQHVADTCRRNGTRLMLNAAPAAALSSGVLAACDPLVVNASEALILLGEDPGTSPDSVELARRLRALGPRSVVLTLGSAGAVAVDGNGDAHYEPALRVTAVDTTGAGDAFVGALARALAGGESLAAGLAGATKVAALAVQRPGAQASYPTAAELEER
jgi:ribokinase